MSETKTPVSITSAKSLKDEPARKQHLLRKQGVKPAENVAQTLLEQAAGGIHPGESSITARRRGLRRVIGAALLPVVLVGGVYGLNQAKKGLGHEADQARAAVLEDHLQPLQDFQKGVKLKSGMIAVNAGNYEGTAIGWAREHAADPSDAGDLTGRIYDQANYQGDPGVQSNEVFVVPRNELTDQTVRELGISGR